MGECVSENVLTEFVEARLSAPEAAALQEHVDSCPACRELLLLVLPNARTGAADGEPELPQPPIYPTRIDEYVVIKPLGQGAMGQVFLAHDTLLDRDVAIKFLADLDPDQASRERFRIEARAIARLQHPNVVTIHRVTEYEGAPCLISELIRGESLDKWPKPIAWPEVLRIGIGLVRGLAAAHRRGVLHRDIKPSNIMMTEDGEAKLLDFGLAKLVDGAGPSASVPPQSRPDFRNATLTRAGTRVGTPLYMSPEIWRGEAASKRSDVYAMGVVLYELCIGHVPITQVASAEHGISQRVRTAAAERGVELDERLAAIIDRCLQRDPEARFQSADALREALESVAAHGARGSAGPGPRIPPGSPYRGLQSFDAEHADLFFGRGAEVRAVLDRLRGQRFVLITADSGVGKSSLCRAGVLPAVRAGLIADGHLWSELDVVLGRRPLQTLAKALSSLCAEDESVLLARLREDPAAVARTLASIGTPGRTLLFIDQLEELFTLAGPEDLADTAECLAALLLHGGELRLLATLRSDFLTRLAALPALGDEAAQALYLLKPLGEEGVHEAIVGPARSKGFRFESEEMIAELMSDALRAPGGLPLLSFTLDALWELRDEPRRLIPAVALQGLGGVTGALAQHADTVIWRMTPKQRMHARRIFQALVSAEGTRLRRSQDELLVRAERDEDLALQQLVRTRLLTVRSDARGPDGGGSYEIAHEALISGWQMLRHWLTDDADRRALIERLSAATREWERMGRDPEGLWSARQLAETAELRADELSPNGAEFLLTSRRRVRRARVLRTLFIASAPAILLSFYGAVWLRHRQERSARIEQQLAEARTALASAAAEHEELERLRSRSLPQYVEGKRGRADADWEQALAHADAADRHYARAGQALETALLIDAARRDVRALFAGALYQQALLAERTYQGRHRDQLLQRLSVQDERGELLARWMAPGQVTIESAPTASVILEQYGGTPRRRPSVLRTGAVTPLLLPSLLPGSYRLILAAPGRAAVRYPFVVERGERLRFEVRLPPQTEVPAGFIHVAEGRFLFGSDAEELQRRRWFNTAPLHQMKSRAFLIAQYETTFGEWIEFLRSLPQAERDLYLFHTGTAHGAQGLRQLPDGRFQLTLKPSSVTYSAAEGEKVLYPGRERRREQDWLRFPVTGVTAAQAVAYTEWLNKGGRIPGARLCTDLEWERAARGADSREYPHGDQMEPDDANFDETYNKEPRSFGPDEVGSHPASASPFGVEDLIGNAFEWVSSPLAAKGFAIRGGSYYYGQLTGRIVNRTEPELSMQNPTQGLRVCADARSE